MKVDKNAIKKYKNLFSLFTVMVAGWTESKVFFCKVKWMIMRRKFSENTKQIDTQNTNLNIPETFFIFQTETVQI